MGSLLSALAFGYWFLWMTRELAGVVLFGSNQNFPLSGAIGPSFAAAALLVQLGRGSLAVNWPRSGKWILGYLAWSGLSVLWSTAHSQEEIFLQWIEFAGQLLFVCLTMSSVQDRAFILKSALLGIVAGACCLGFYVVTIFTPDYDLRLDQTLHPNFLGHRIALGALSALFLWSTVRQRWLYTAALVLLVIPLLFTTSKTAIGAFALAAAVFLLSQRRLTAKAKLRVVAVIGAAALFALPLVIRNFQVYAETSEFFTLTGRIPLWFAVAAKIQERPWLGFGYHSFADNWPARHWFSGSAHNELLEQWFTVGLVGILILVRAYRELFRALRRSRSAIGGFAILMLIYCLIRGLTEADDTHLQLALLFACALPRAGEIAHRAARRALTAPPQPSLAGLRRSHPGIAGEPFPGMSS